MAQALVLVLVVVMSCLVASTVGFAEVFRRAAMFSLNQASKRQQGGMQCCLPSEFTLSSEVSGTADFDGRSSRLPFESGSFDFVYSAKANKIYFKLVEGGRPMGSAVAEIDNGKVSIKAADRRSCRYDSLGQFSDSFFTKFVDGQLCIPDAFLNFNGSHYSFEGKPAEMYNLYNFEFSSEMNRPNAINGGLQMKALRFEDGSCLPVEFTAYQSTRRPDSSYKFTFALKSPSYSTSADFKLFDSAC